MKKWEEKTKEGGDEEVGRSNEKTKKGEKTKRLKETEEELIFVTSAF